MLPTDFLDGGAVGIVEGAVQQVQADPGAAREAQRHPRGLGVQAVDAFLVVPRIRGQQDRQAIRHAVFEVGGMQPVSPLLAARAPERDQLGQVAVAIAVLRQQDERKRVRAVRILQVEVGAYDERQLRALRLRMRAHDPGQRALVGDRQRRIAQLHRPRHQFLRVRCPLQEGEVRQAEQLRILGQAQVQAKLGGWLGWHRCRIGLQLS
jgi:hypothetical protein